MEDLYFKKLLTKYRTMLLVCFTVCRSYNSDCIKMHYVILSIKRLLYCIVLILLMRQYQQLCLCYAGDRSCSRKYEA